VIVDVPVTVTCEGETRRRIQGREPKLSCERALGHGRACLAKVVRQTLRIRIAPRRRATMQWCTSAHRQASHPQVGVDFTRARLIFGRICIPPVRLVRCPPPESMPTGEEDITTLPETCIERRSHAMQCCRSRQALFPPASARASVLIALCENCTRTAKSACPTEQLDPPHQGKCGVQSGKFRMISASTSNGCMGRILAIQSHNSCRSHYFLAMVEQPDRDAEPTPEIPPGTLRHACRRVDPATSVV